MSFLWFKIRSKFINGKLGNSSIRLTLELPPTSFKCNECGYPPPCPLSYAYTSNKLDQITSLYTFCGKCENKGERILGVDIEDLSRYLFIFIKRGKYIYFED